MSPEDGAVAVVSACTLEASTDLIRSYCDAVITNAYQASGLSSARQAKTVQQRHAMDGAADFEAAADAQLKQQQQQQEKEGQGHMLTAADLVAMGVQVQKRRRTSSHAKMVAMGTITLAVVVCLYVAVIHPMSQEAAQENCQGRWSPNGHCVCHRGGELGFEELAYEVVQHAIGGGLPCDDMADATSEYRQFMPDDLARFCHCPHNVGPRAKVGQIFEQILGTEGGPGPWQEYDTEGVQQVLPGRRYQFMIERLPTDPGAIRSNFKLLRDLKAATGGKLDPFSYSAQMVAVCSTYGMKPVCNHAAQCEFDNHSLYIGQAGQLTLSRHREDNEFNPSGFERIAQNWDGLCSYTSADPMHAQYWYPSMQKAVSGELRCSPPSACIEHSDIFAELLRDPFSGPEFTYARMEHVTPATAYWYGIYLDSHGARVPCQSQRRRCLTHPPNGTCQDSDVCTVTQGEVQGNRTLCEGGYGGAHGYRWDGLTTRIMAQGFNDGYNDSIGWFNTSDNPGFMCGRALTKEDQMDVAFVRALGASNGVPAQVYRFMPVRLNASVINETAAAAASSERNAGYKVSGERLYRVADLFQSCDSLWLSHYSREYDSCDEPKDQSECFAAESLFDASVEVHTKIDLRHKLSYARCDAKYKTGMAQLSWRPDATGTCDWGKYPCVCVCRRGGDPDGGKGHMTSYSAAMVRACAEHGMKPICNDPRYCQYDSNALYIGQIGMLSIMADRYSPGMMPQGFQAIADKWAGLCGFIGTNESIVGRQNMNRTVCDMTWAHVRMQWRTVAYNPGFMCGKVMTQVELRQMYTSESESVT